MEGQIQQLRELERAVVKDLSQCNNIIELRKVAANTDKPKELRTAAIHCLRRLFMEFLETGKVIKPSAAKEKGKTKKANEKFYQWFLVQYQDFQQTLCNLISSDQEWSHALSIRTMMELIKVDHLIFTNTVQTRYIAEGSNFGVETFHALLQAIIFTSQEIDVDLLLMLKDEIMIYRDCTFYGLKILQEMILELKEEYTQLTVLPTTEAIQRQSELDMKKKNVLDFIRIVSIEPVQGGDDEEEEEEEEEEEFWIEPHSAASYQTYINTLDITDMKAMLEQQAQDEEEEEGGVEGMEEGVVVANASEGEVVQDVVDDDQANVLHETTAKKFLSKKELQKQAEMEQVLALLGKRKQTEQPEDNNDSNKKKKKKRLAAEYEQLIDQKYYMKWFTKVWLSFLSLPFNLSDHKLILKHLPDHVITSFTNPLILSDYLTIAYEFGHTMISLLALESLFYLIVQYNLDYPQFFESLYALCNLDIFLAKYAPKYMKLLHLSLKSTNIPGYLIQCFVKKLAALALLLPSPQASYCIIQIKYLFKQHRVSQQLIHMNTSKQQMLLEKLLSTVTLSKKVSEGLSEEEIHAKKIEYLSHKVFDVMNTEQQQISHLPANVATYSSLYEIEALQNHHIYEIAQLAKSLMDPESTSSGVILPSIDRYLTISYEQLIDQELRPIVNKDKKNNKDEEDSDNDDEEGGEGKKKKKGVSAVPVNCAFAVKKPKGLFGNSLILGKIFGPCQ